MKAMRLPPFLTDPFRRVKWRLTLSYLAVTLAAVLILAWWGLVAGAFYLQRTVMISGSPRNHSHTCVRQIDWA